MTEMMTIQEIEERYKSEWVLLEDPEMTPSLEVIRARVLWHSKDRDEVWRKALELRPKHSAVLYMGTITIPEGTAIVL